MNDVRRLHFGDALLPALFFVVKVIFLVFCLEKVYCHSYEIPTPRVGRPVTRLTVNWAFS